MGTQKVKRTILSCLIILFAVFSACPVITAQETKQPPLNEVIDTEGKIKDGTDGSFDASGYKMTYGADGEPVFTLSEFDGTPSWSPLGAGHNNIVRAVAVSGNDVYVGGDFTTAGGILANRIAKWDGASWSALGSGFNNIVLAIAVSGNDVYAGGRFTTAGGIPVNRIAKWDGTGWSALGVGPNFSYIFTIAVSGNDVYAGGFIVFTATIKKWDGTSWSDLGSGFSDNGLVFAIAVSGNDVYVGGYFTTVGGDSANNIAKWDGTSWTALGSGLNNRVYAIAVSGNDVYAGGWFTTAGGIPANRIAKWDGTSWSPLGAGLDSVVYAIAVSGNDVYVGGYFTTAGGNPASRIAKWDGASWSPLGSGANNRVLAVSTNGSGVYVGGEFNIAGGFPASRIAKWSQVPPSPDSLIFDIPQFGSVQLNWTDNSFNEDGFVIERAVNSPFWTILDTVNANTTSFLDTGLTTGDHYHYRVYAYNSTGNSGYTNIVSTLITGITGNTHSGSIPGEYALHQNYPNPFNPSTTIKFDLPKEGVISLKIYDMAGREAANLINDQRMNAGVISHNFNGNSLASGIYFYSLVVDGQIIATKKMLLIK